MRRAFSACARVVLSDVAESADAFRRLFEVVSVSWLALAASATAKRVAIIMEGS